MSYQTHPLAEQGIVRRLISRTCWRSVELVDMMEEREIMQGKENDDRSSLVTLYANGVTMNSV